ncbi:MAG: LysR family transcriptional regulator [Rhodobacteraceae bacterium]|nr:LysR family transcriptional regulator [Paracoccaceae bacterium]MCP5342324.1 LysR family transcriptional regulator [Paracoccaceae bacterium]
MMLKLEMMRCFRAVAFEGTLAGAAAVLGRTPSAISMMLKQFEEHLGAPLFETDRKNRLTPLGLRVLEEATRATDVFDRAAEAIRRHAHSTAGTVRIASVPSAATSILPDAIRSFRHMRPEIRLEVSDVDSAAVINHLQFDMADIGIASGQSGPDIEAEALASDRLGIVCRQDSPIMTSGQAVNWEMLDLEPFVANPLCTLVDHPTVQHLVATSLLSARNTTTLLSFVRNGFGATILPRRVLLGEATDLAFLSPQAPVVERQLKLLTSRQRHPSPAANAFREVVLNMARAM